MIFFSRFPTQILIDIKIKRISQYSLLISNFGKLKLLNILKRSMIQIQSPFIKQIPECRLVMRRLRKKISKYTSTHKEAKKPRDQSHDILNLLKDRNLPSFVLDTIRKRRTFDLQCLKNVVMSSQSSLEEMMRITNDQEKQIQGLFSEHKLRIRKSTPKIYPKFERRSTNCSSTEEDQNQQSSISMDSLQNSNNFTDERNSSKQLRTGNQLLDGEHHFEQELPLFHDRDFLIFQGDLYSEEQWMKF